MSLIEQGENNGSHALYLKDDKHQTGEAFVCDLVISGTSRRCNFKLDGRKKSSSNVEKTCCAPDRDEAE
jgi:hypothetical protein